MQSVFSYCHLIKHNSRGIRKTKHGSYSSLRYLFIKLHHEGKSNREIEDAMKAFFVSKTFVTDALRRSKEV